MQTLRPPRDNLVRAVASGLELRAAGDDQPSVLHGHFAVWDTWTEINSLWEGNFLESLSRGAFAKTIDESRSQIKVLFNHGMDPQIGNKILGPIDTLEEDDEGVRYEVPLLDTSYNRDLMPGLQAGLYGASFRFRVVKEEFNKQPQRSSYNPDGLPERTIKEVQLLEFGPVSFPQYPEASAGLRSMTDEFQIDLLLRDPKRLRELLLSRTSEDESTQEPGEPTPSADDTEPAETTPEPTPTPLPRHAEWMAARTATKE